MMAPLTTKGSRTQMSAPINDPAKQAAVSAADHEYVFHSWSAALTAACFAGSFIGALICVLEPLVVSGAIINL